jgi:hypothetical protein
LRTWENVIGPERSFDEGLTDHISGEQGARVRPTKRAFAGTGVPKNMY